MYKQTTSVLKTCQERGAENECLERYWKIAFVKIKRVRKAKKLLWTKKSCLERKKIGLEYSSEK